MQNFTSTAILLQQIRGSVPDNLKASFDSQMAAIDNLSQQRVLELVRGVETVVLEFGGIINWPCLFQVLPLIVAGISNPTALLAALTAYFNCAYPHP
jgi:hypothetical protein